MKRLLLSLVAIVLVTFSMAAPAGAQGDQAITVEPATVSEPGEYEFTVSGTGYTGSAFLLPCPGAEGDIANLAEDSCDLNQLTPVAPDDDGNVEGTATFEVPAEGLLIVIGNADQTEVAATVVTVGEAEAAEEEAAEEAADDSAAASADDDALASTGVESFQFVVIGATMLLAGLMLARFSRRHV